MGNFQQHITCSTATGIAVGGLAYGFGFEADTCLVAAGLCSFAGMLPDLDSDSSHSFRECVYLLAGIGCILTVSRLRYYEFDADFAMFGGAMMLLLIRFGVGSWIKKITVHRGMIHSIPVAVLAGQLIFFAVTGAIEERILKAAALTIGFLSHLVLDEYYSIDWSKGKPRLKKSFGTALKWTNPKRPGPVAIIYALNFGLACAAFSNPSMLERQSDGVELAEQTSSQSESSAPLSRLFSGRTGTVAQTQQSDVQREAAEFLAQFSSVSATASVPYAQQAVPIPAAPASTLPSAMQIGSDWNRNTPIQPARIVLP